MQEAREFGHFTNGVMLFKPNGENAPVAAVLLWMRK
jgi:hypothetical protein